MIDKETLSLGGLVLVGAAVGLGQMLLSDVKLTWRLVVGRALSSGGIGLAAASLLTAFPALPFAAQVGLAALMASLGTSALERILQRIVGGN